MTNYLTKDGDVNVLTNYIKVSRTTDPLMDKCPQMFKSMAPQSLVHDHSQPVSVKRFTDGD